MPVHCPIAIPCLDAGTFEEIDYPVMGHAYASQNELGQWRDERIYEADLKARVLANGFGPVYSQVPLTVSYGAFSM